MKTLIHNGPLPEASTRDVSDILAGCVAGSPAAWRDFAGRYHRLITGCAVRFGLPEHAEDIVQLVYMRLIQSDFALLRRFRGSGAAFTVYLKNIAKNVAYNYRKKMGRSAGREIPLESLPEQGYGGMPEFPITPAELLEEIMKLNLPYRIVLHLRFMGYNHREIADILDRPLNTVLTHSHRAVFLLKSRLLMQ